MTLTHLSYSSLNTYKSCPRAYYLSRVKQAWSVPAWYFIVGSTVHDMIEQKCTTGLPDPSPALIEDHFMELVHKSMEKEPDTTKWLAGGSKDEPVVEERALKLALDCYENAVTFLDDCEVHLIEFDVSNQLPGCTVPIKAFPDAYVTHKKHGPLVVDWKTGKSKPPNLQLETYYSNWRLGGPRLSTAIMPPAVGTRGLYAMLNPAATKARPFKFKETPQSLGKIYGDVEQQINKKIARPDPGFMCRFCDMAPNCTTNSGRTKRAVYYDTPEKDGWFPF